MERTSISRGVGQRPAGATSILVRSLSVVLFAAGLTLMLLTLGFNLIGYYMRKKYREVY